jgi:hypothetical protein
MVLRLLRSELLTEVSVIKISSRRFLGVDKNEFRHPVRSLDT